MVHYSASKAALGSASEALRVELREYGIHVLTVYPGPVQTAMADLALARYEKDPMGVLPMGDAGVLAELVLRAIETKQARVVYPRFYSLLRFAPWLVRWVVDTFGTLPKALPK